MLPQVPNQKTLHNCILQHLIGATRRRGTYGIERVAEAVGVTLVRPRYAERAVSTRLLQVAECISVLAIGQLQGHTHTHRYT